ncbi:Sapep family Mn(2+)-dependent dipeptidase [Carnobacterium maltaromaticum]|jgi:succinyl-diaminopimelate desuccinylase|uniref:Sapep family Mn(2+)-dependent dipeptidase n=1 Tax=Carnobacterium maltaromaticum TaxID=2751 RepID=UPI000E76938C|nr:Sapep family Mn(2+)-dependent dipeptidase [Carnobacterium maltaromaticum]AOA02881.1 peptidase M20 [Carnobacterium maltaromaticum]MCI1819350.1 Sapep family Mn(2+)-dependent dipeptidase [Carnobacterium maltaromaticum]
MHEQIKAAVKGKEAEFLAGLKKVMKVDSVKGLAETGAPFGKGPKKALETALDLASALGFETKIVSDAVGYAQYGTNNDEYLGIVGHLDVVEAGSGWSYPPFDLTLENGVLYGRGVLDNKGPAISTLYALSVLKELNIPLSKTIRILFGTDEESGSADIPLYLASEKPPIYGFTPDCKYPAVYGERGLVGIEIVTVMPEKELKQISNFKGTFTRSSVPDYLEVTLKNGEEIQIEGKRAPSNAPEMGENVLTKFAEIATNEHFFTGELADYFSWLATALHLKHDGSGLGIDFSDQASGKLMLTPYAFKIEKNKVHLTLSIRYPISVTEEDILVELKQHLPMDSQLQIIRKMPATSFPLEHPMLKIMQEVYEECTGMDGTPVTTTGATYARTMPNIVAFGPSFPGQKGIAHNKDEYMDLTDLMKNMEIYAVTMAELAK